MNIQATLATLVKNNDGFFKSEKQANFLTDLSIDGLIVVSHRMFNNVSYTHYVLDNSGVSLVRKVKQDGSNTLVWDRNDPSIAQAIADAKTAKHVKRILRDMKHNKSAMEEYIENSKKYTKTSEMYFFNRSMKSRSEDFIGCIEKYEELTGETPSIEMPEFSFFSEVPTYNAYSYCTKARNKLKILLIEKLKGMDNIEEISDWIEKYKQIDNKISEKLELIGG